MGETLEYSAQLVDAFTPVLEQITAALGTLSDQMVQLSETISESMQASVEATGELAGAMDTLTASVAAATNSLDLTSATLDINTTALEENTAALEDNAAADDANTAAKDKNAASTSNLGQQFSNLKMPLLIAGGALAAIGATALIVGSQYESAMAVVQGLTGQTAQTMQSLNTQILAMAQDLGASPTQLAQGLYYILSAGFDASDSMKILKEVVEGASAAMVDQSVYANVLTTYLRDFGAGADQAAAYSDKLIEIVTLGKTTFSDLASAFGKAATVAQATGVSANELGAAIAVLTVHGTQADQAEQNLALTMTELDLKQSSLAKNAKALGISFNEAQYNSMSFQEKLHYLWDQTGHNAQAFMHLFTNMTAGQTAYKLMMDNGSMLDADIQKLATSAGNTANAFQIHEQTMAGVWDHLKATTEVTLIKIDQALEPVASAVMNALMPAISAFGDWASKNGPLLATIFGTLAATIGVMLVGALAGAAAGFIAANAAAIGITGGIGLLAGAAILLVGHWQQILHFLEGTSTPAIIVKGVLAGLAVVAGMLALDALPALGTALISGTAATWGFVTSMWALIAPFAAIALPVAAVAIGLMELYQHFAPFRELVNSVANALKEFWSFLVANIGPALQTVGNFLKTVFLDAWHGLQAAFQAILGPAETIGSIFKDVLGAAVQWLGQQLSPLVDVWNNHLLPAFAGIGDIARDVGSTFSNIGTLVSTIVTKLLQLFHSWEPTLKQIASIVGGILVGAFHVLSTVLGWVGAVIGVIANVLKAVLGAAIQFILPVLGALGSTFTGIFTGIAQVVGSAVQLVVGILQSLWGGISGVVGLIVDLVTGKFNKLWSDVVNIFKGLMSGVSNIWNGLLGMLEGAWNMTGGRVVGLIQGFVSGIEGFFKSLAGNVTDVWNNIWGGLGNILKDAWHGVTDFLAGVINKVIDILNGMISGANHIPFVNIPYIPHVHFAKGGIMEQLGLAVVGEEGPEVMLLPGGTQVFPNAVYKALSQALSGAGLGIQSQEIGAGGASLSAAPSAPLVAAAGSASGGIKELHIHIEPKGSFRDGMSLMNGAQQDRFARQIADALAKQKSLQVIGDYGYAGS